MSQKLTSCEIQKRLPIGLPSTNENIYGSIRDCQVQGYSDGSQETNSAYPVWTKSVCGGLTQELRLIVLFNDPCLGMYLWCTIIVVETKLSSRPKTAEICFKTEAFKNKQISCFHSIRRSI